MISQWQVYDFASHILSFAGFSGFCSFRRIRLFADGVFQVTCLVPELPGGLYSVRPRTASGYVRAYHTPFLSKLAVTSYTQIGGQDAKLVGGYGGGVDIVLQGYGLGDASKAVLHSIEMCGLPCEVQTHTYSELVCRAPELLTLDALFRYNHRESDSLTPFAEIMSLTSTGYDDFWVARRYFDDDLAYENRENKWNGYVGLRVKSGGYAYVNEIRFYPPVLNQDRDRLIGAQFQVRNTTGSWATVFTVSERPRGGWNTINSSFVHHICQEMRFIQPTRRELYLNELMFVGLPLPAKQYWDGKCRVDVTEIHATEADASAIGLATQVTVEHAEIHGSVAFSGKGNNVEAQLNYGSKMLFTLLVSPASAEKALTTIELKVRGRKSLKTRLSGIEEVVRVSAFGWCKRRRMLHGLPIMQATPRRVGKVLLLCILFFVVEIMVAAALVRRSDSFSGLVLTISFVLLAQELP